MTDGTPSYCDKLKQELSFHFLSAEDNRRLLGYLRCAKARAGERLWREGERCGDLAFIVSGKLEIRKQTEFAGKDVIVGVYGPGSIVGELCILQEMPRSVGVVALTDCELLLLSAEQFEALAARDPELAVRLLKGMLLTVSTRLGKAFERLAAIF